ncbi:uncharacterized protein LOC143034473 isoform X2 [Oratosquilla oratoria]|uniref:uncharacterized protein LOC143034473 isoform X2 n=1 Tax=Oratosquilla oratoria TaxID=337810 RepID=UPI003F76EE55
MPQVFQISNLGYCALKMIDEKSEPPKKKVRKRNIDQGRCCSVWKCGKSRGRHGLGVFGFPKPDKEPARFAKWVRVVKHTRANFTYHPASSFICADHFPEESIANLTKIRLLREQNPHDKTPWKLVPDAVPLISMLPPRPRPGSSLKSTPVAGTSMTSSLANHNHITVRSIPGRPAAAKRERKRIVDALLQASELETAKSPQPYTEPDEDDYMDYDPWTRPKNHPLNAGLNHGVVPSQSKWSRKLSTEMSIEEEEAHEQVEMTVPDFPFIYVDMEHFANEEFNDNDFIKEHDVGEDFWNEMDGMDEVVVKEETVNESLLDEDEFHVNIVDVEGLDHRCQ